MHGIINLNKPKGFSSQQAVTAVKKILRVAKAGHAGTLDPGATGVLLVCVGEATKITRFLADLDKQYHALVKLGEKTDTYDAEGVVTESRSGFVVERQEIEAILPRFTGVIEQIPPMYSAIKMDGKPLYDLARRGVTVERLPRTVTVHRIEITSYQQPLLGLRLSCSKGTYVRSLCNDIGDLLGVGAHIRELERTGVGRFRIEDSVTLDSLRASAGGGMTVLTGIDEALGHLEEIRLTEAESASARNGMAVKRTSHQAQRGSFFRMKDPSGTLFAIGRSSEDRICIERIIHTGNTIP